MPMLVVVDGSNIATEGRPMPSLRQLHEAVMAFREEHPQALITVVVDATFGHRIEPAEVPEFDAAVEHNELVTPPAGAVGRGDAFVLTIANKANATILSNDSFQEFHGQYPWLFDDGRLIGGKPVPHVGWVFVPRTPVRGPTSRKAVRTARQAVPATTAKKKVVADGQATVVAGPADGKRVKAAGDGAAPSRRRTRSAPEAVDGQAPHRAQGTDTPTPGRQQMVNELLPFLAFVEEHPVGSQVEGVTDSYSSHGAYVLVGETRCYVPLRYLGHPAPRSAREVLRLGAPQTFTVVSFNPARRSIDLALAGAEPAGLALVAGAASTAVAKRSRKKAAPVPPAAAAEEPAVGAPKRATKQPAGKRATKQPAKRATKQEPDTAPPVGKRAATARSAKAAAPAPAGRPATASAKQPAKRATKQPATKQPSKRPVKGSAAKQATPTSASRPPKPAKRAVEPAGATAAATPAKRRSRAKAATT